MSDFPELARRDFLKSALSLSALAGLPAVVPQRLLNESSHGDPAIPYGVGNWSSGAFDPLGNHRAVIRVAQAADAVRVRVPWRRHDTDPQKKNIILVHAGTHSPLKNLVRLEVNRDFGEFIFQPEQGAGDYFLYYLPTNGPGRSSNYPVSTYPPPILAADSAWLQKNGLLQLEDGNPWPRRIPRARVVEFQSVDAFNSFYPMGVIATADETSALLRLERSPLLLFPEDRSRSIRMNADLPRSWIQRGPQKPFQASVKRNEYFSMQIGAYATNQRVDNITISFSEFRTRSGDSLSPSLWTCFGTGGIDANGQSFTHQLSIDKGQVQPLWIGVQIPQDAQPGDYRGRIMVSAENVPPIPIDIHLTVGNQLLADSGDSDPDQLSRLRWLNSKLAEDDSIVPPYTPATLDGNTIAILGRTVTVGPDGFPARIASSFAPSNTHLIDQARELLNGSISLVIEGSKPINWRPGKLRFEPHAPGRVDWSVTNTAGPLTMQLHASMEFDGHISFMLGISSSEILDLRDIRLEVPLLKDAAVYMMGMGQKGGYRPPAFQWKWDVKKNQDSLWVGDVNAGLQVSLRDDKYSRPLNTNFYHLKPLVMPASWENDGKGGCSLIEHDPQTVLLSCYSGARTLHPRETHYYNFELLLTPFKPLDTATHWHNRYFHKSDPPPSEVRATGANVINIHHGTSINPYLNYPFLREHEMKSYIDEAHILGMKVKIYYTVRELSNHSPEIFMLRSLGHEVFVPGPGGGYSWLQEQLGSDYIAGWCVPSYLDATIINSGSSRWHNYYVEGIQYLAKNVGIDGLYLDDLAFDRSIMQRVRRVLDTNRPGALIDLHSANQYDERDGFASSANLYMGELPYLNRLWFGEYFDYNAEPDYYLIEISGIAFGLMGEMLQGGGNPWRGMVYGMTARMGASGDPRPLWEEWNTFGIGESRMEGYWSSNAPVTTNRKDVLATSYIRLDAVLIAVASWASENTSIHLDIHWDALSLRQADTRLTAPAIEGFQDAATYNPADAIPIPQGRGLLLVLSARSGS